jgi:hypothetical protein
VNTNVPPIIDKIATGVAWLVTALVTLTMIAVGLAIIAAVSWPFMSWSCDARYGSVIAGATTSYGPIQGCQIVLPDGRRIPAEAFREPVR